MIATVYYCSGQESDTGSENDQHAPLEMEEADSHDLYIEGRVVSRVTIFECPQCGHSQNHQEDFDDTDDDI